jgi:subtilase family serine protease
VRSRTLLRNLSVAALAATAAIAGTAAGTSANADTATLGITQNLLPGLANATDLGAAPAATPLHLVVSLARPNPAGEQALLDAEHDPSSPSYGQFLTPDQFAQQFGVPAAQRSAVTSFLTGGGLTVASVSAAGDQYSVEGDVAHVGALFNTSFHEYSTGGRTFVANTTVPSFPWGLGITNIVGLNTLQGYSLPARSGTGQDLCVQSTCTGTTTPKDLWTAYDQPATYTGQNQGLAVFGEGQTDGVISDLRQFETEQGLPQIPVTVKHPAGDTTFTDDSGHGEWNIDTQASSGMAPNATGLTLYFGSDLSDADVDRVFTTFTDDSAGPLQASASYGECETIPVISPLASQPLSNPTIASLPAGIGIGNDNDATLTAITRQAAIEGKSIFVSTGDTGSSCPLVYAAVIGAGNGVVNQAVPVTNSPASLPYVVAVGGTVLYTDGAGNRVREYGWAYSGGGSTLFTPEPSYQQGVSGVNIPCVTTTAICRGVPDVAAQSGDVLTNGYDIVSAGADSIGGGTSLSAPLEQGMWARVQSAAKNRNKGNGFADYAYYGAYKKAYAQSFFDVSSTDTTTGLPASNGAYETLPGYDYVTGLGVPRVAGLICVVDKTGC